MGHEYAYQPMGERKQLSFEHMLEVLAKHGGAQRQAPAEIPPPSTPVNTGSLPVPRLSDELWLAEKLNKAGARWKAFQGETWPDVRRERTRSVILAANLGSTQCGKRNGVPVTYGEIFAVIYGQPL